MFKRTYLILLLICGTLWSAAPAYSNPVEPQFPKGKAALTNFLQNNISYTERMASYNVSGIMTLVLFINEYGKVSKFETSETGVKDCIKEVENCLKIMPKWTPGKTPRGPVGGIFRIDIFFSAQSRQIFARTVKYMGKFKESDKYEPHVPGPPHSTGVGVAEIPREYLNSSHEKMLFYPSPVVYFDRA